MAQTQNVHSPGEQFLMAPATAYTGYADFRWFLSFVVIPDPIIEDCFEVKATILIDGTTEYAINSLPVQATYGKITLTFPPFPPASQRVEEGNSDDYRGKVTGIVNNVDHLSNSIRITLSRPAISGALPTIQLNASTIDQQWLIGARDILLVEPPSTEMESEHGKA